jgi:hypothetical protein
MSIYPVEFHRRLERKWAHRIDQVLTVAPPRDPNDEDDDEDEEDEDQGDEPAVVREPDEN